MDCLENKIVKTRKQHSCWGCRNKIKVGEMARLTVCVDDDGFSRAYWCPVCDFIIALMEYWQTEDGFVDGEIIDNYPDTYDLISNDISLGKLKPFGTLPKKYEIID